MPTQCPLCGPDAPEGTPGALLGAYARAEHDRAELLDRENRALIEANTSLETQLKIAMDALHTFIAPKPLQQHDLNTIDARKELPPP